MLTRTLCFRHVIVIKVSSCAESGQRKQTTEPVADENSYLRRVGIPARSAQSRDLPLERDWQPGLVGFASVDVMPVQYIVCVFPTTFRSVCERVEGSICAITGVFMPFTWHNTIASGGRLRCLSES